MTLLAREEFGVYLCSKARPEAQGSALRLPTYGVVPLRWSFADAWSEGGVTPKDLPIPLPSDHRGYRWF